MSVAVQALAPHFVEFIPKDLEEGVLYISIEYTTTAHKCACGCGHKVVLPLHPTDWRLTFDGKSITIRPSVGNWGFPCRSHYLITGNRVEWADDWTDEQVAAGRNLDVGRRTSWHGRTHPVSPAPHSMGSKTASPHGWLRKILIRILGS